MNMIRHDNGDLKIELGSVVTQAAVENNRPNRLRQNPASVRAESYKVRLVIDLEMWQLPPVESLRHRTEICGLSLPRLACRGKLRLILIVGFMGFMQPSFLTSGRVHFPIREWAPPATGELCSPGQPRAAVPTWSLKITN